MINIFGISKYKLLNICFINENACVTLSARKNIQAKTVKKNVSKIFTTSLMLGKTPPSPTMFKLSRFLLKNNSGKK